MKQEEIAAHVAHEMGLEQLTGLSDADHAMVEQQTREAIKGCSTETDETVDCFDADRTMRCLLAEHCALTEENRDAGT